jgi:hypothetical protein
MNAYSPIVLGASGVEIASPARVMQLAVRHSQVCKHSKSHSSGDLIVREIMIEEGWR